MADSFLHLPEDERRAIYAAGAEALGRSPVILEKDIWVCWSLAVLFGEGLWPMAFKGGTALSKAHHALDRFSEDIDVTVQVPGASVLDEDDLPSGANQRRALAAKLNGELEEYITQRLRPLISTQLESVPGAARVDQPENSTCDLIITYPSCVVPSSDPPYVAQQVKLEFGARNLIDPRTTNRIVPYLADVPLSEPLAFPVAESVEVLAIERIFWEKATLAHDHCNRKLEDTAPSERISRHWYDLAVLADQGAAVLAHGRRDQLESVVKIKNLFYRRATSDYEACLAGGLRLVPADARLHHLEADYDAMVEAGMFLNEPRAFNTIIDTLRSLEAHLNGEH